MRQSNRNFNILPPLPLPGKARALDYLLCPGSGELDLCLRGVGKIEPEVSGLFFGRGSDPIFKSSNVRALPRKEGGGGGREWGEGLKFRVDRRIINVRENQNTRTTSKPFIFTNPTASKNKQRGSSAFRLG